MSQGVRIALAEAAPIAAELMDLLRPACERLVIAGSIRRRKPEVGDIELVAIARQTIEPGGDLWGEATTLRDHLSERIADLWAAGTLEPRRVEVHRADGTVEEGRRMGNAYRALMFRDLPVDLFCTDAERWGCILALRTGPGDWNVKLVMDCKRFFRRVEGGRVLHLGRPVPTPTEEEFFRAVGQPWVHPWDRHPNRIRIVSPESLPA